MADESKLPNNATDDPLLTQALDRYDVADDYYREVYELSDDDRLFLHNIDNHQWPESVRADRADRPMITVNKIKKFIKSVSGQQRQNKMTLKVTPDGNEKEVAAAISIIIGDIAKDSRTAAIYSDAFEKQIGGGFGYWRYDTEYRDDDSFDQVIKCYGIQDPTTVLFDPTTKEYTRRDARYCFILTSIAIEQFKQNWPDVEVPSTEFRGRENRKSWIYDNTVQIAEYFFKVPVPFQLLELRDGATLRVSKEDMERLDKDLISQVVRSRPVMVDTINWALMTETGFLEEPRRRPGKYIPVVPVVGDEVKIKNKYHVGSFTRDAKDPQRMYNYWRTAATEYVASIPKNPYIVTQKQIKGHEHHWQNSLRDNPMFLVVNDVNGMKLPVRNSAPSIPTGIVTEANIASGDIDDTLGMYEASKGQAGNEVSGAAIQTRQQVSSTITYGYVDNFIQSMYYSGEILLDLIPEVYDTPQVIKRLDDKNITLEEISINSPVVDPASGTVRIENSLKSGKYRVNLDVGFGYSTRRQEAVQGMLQMFQYLPGFGQYFADIFAENMDWPGAEKIADRFRALLPEQFQEGGAAGQGGPPPPGSMGPGGGMPQSTPSPRS